MHLTQDIVELAIEKACCVISENLDERFVYHDLSHTVAVVEAAGELARKLDINKQQRMLLTVAAWFHDTGYSKQITDHEKHGAELVENFLKEYKIDEQEISIIRNCILATKIPQEPVTLLDRIICDADMVHLSARNFRTTSDNLREEWRLTKGEVYTDKEWLMININFLSKHKYQTAVAQKEFEKRKQKNLKMLVGTCDDMSGKL